MIGFRREGGLTVVIVSFVRENRRQRHLFFKCRFTIRVWREIKNWLAMHELEMDACPGMLLVNEWWERMVLHTGHRRKATTSLFMLAVRELWKERNEGFPRQIHHVF